MDWEKVSKYLDDVGFALLKSAEFHNDLQEAIEMRTRARIFIAFGEALRVGLVRDAAQTGV